MISRISVFLIAFLLIACNRTNSNSDNSSNIKSIPTINYTFCKSYPHDITSFTEGFEIHNGELWESTGASKELIQTRSLFGIVDTATGKIKTKVELDRNKYFGEGITFLKGKIYQLTYRSKVCFIYDAATFKSMGRFTFPSKEGWGLTNDGTSLIMSDGTNKLSYIDPSNLLVIKTITVSENGYVRNYLNELEYIRGYIYANIWTTNSIVKIDPSDGKVVGMLDLAALEYEAKFLYPDLLEMNGIAYDSIEDKILITGKLWPKIYEIKITP